MDLSRKSESAKDFFGKLETYYRDLSALNALGRDLENRMKQNPQLLEAAKLLFDPSKHFVLERPRLVSLEGIPLKQRRKNKKRKAPDPETEEEVEKEASKGPPESQEDEATKKSKNSSQT